MIAPFLLLAAAFTGQTTPAPTPQTEMLGIDVPDEFAVGYHARNDAIDITELVAAPDTVEAWTRLITLQLFFGLAPRADTGAFYARWRDSMRQACPGLTDAASVGTVDGQPALSATLACPNNPATGKPENLSIFLVKGSSNLMMVQVAVRHTFSSQDTALIQRVGGSLKVCDERALDACKARKATGFTAAKP